MIMTNRAMGVMVGEGGIIPKDTDIKQEGLDMLGNDNNFNIIMEDKRGISEREQVKRREETKERKKRKENDTSRGCNANNLNRGLFHSLFKGGKFEED